MALEEHNSLQIAGQKQGPTCEHIEGKLVHKGRKFFYSLIYRWISNSLIIKQMIRMIKIPLQEKIGSCYFAPISTQFPRRRLLKATFSFVITQTLTLFLCCQEITKLKIEKGVQ